MSSPLHVHFFLSSPIMLVRSFDAQVLVGRLVDMGFSRPQAEEALMMSGGDPDQAAVRLMMPVRGNADSSAEQNLFLKRFLEEF